VDVRTQDVRNLRSMEPPGGRAITSGTKVASTNYLALRFAPQSYEALGTQGGPYTTMLPLLIMELVCTPYH